MERPLRKDIVIEMLAKEPDDLFLNYALAMEYLAINDLQSTVHQLEKTLNLNKEYLPCYYQLGQVNEKLNNIEKAIDYYNRGIDLAKTQHNTKALGELNEALWMLED